MKKIIRIIVLLLIMGVIVQSTIAADNPMTLQSLFPNASLRLFASEKLGVSDEEPITQEILDTLTSFDSNSLSGGTIDALSDLLPFRNLESIIIRNQTFENLTVFGDFKNLKEFAFMNGDLSSLKGIEASLSIEDFTLAYNTNTSFHNDASALLPLSNLQTLRFLSIRNSAVTTEQISAIRDLAGLTFLKLDDNRITNLEAISALTNLNTLSLFNNNMSEISGIEKLSMLTSLELSNADPTLLYNGVQDFSGLDIASAGTSNAMNFDMDRNARKSNLGFEKNEDSALYFVALDAYKPARRSNESMVFIPVLDDYPGATYNASKHRIELTTDFVSSHDFSEPLFELRLTLVSTNTVYGRIFVYSDEYPLPITESSVTVNFVDQQNVQLSEPIVLQGPVGEPYTLPEFDNLIEGFRFVETISDANELLVFQNEPLIITAVYEALPVVSSVTAHYVDEDKNELIDSSVLSGNVGTSYEISVPDIEGYEFISSSSVLVNRFQDTSITIFLNYKKQAVIESVSPDEEVIPLVVEEPKKPVVEKPNENIDDKISVVEKETHSVINEPTMSQSRPHTQIVNPQKEVLPNTGKEPDYTVYLVFIAGCILIELDFLFGSKKRRS